MDLVAKLGSWIKPAKKQSLPEHRAIKTFDVSFADFLRANDSSNQDLMAMECIRLYKKCLPFFDAVNRRAEAFSSIPLEAELNEDFIDHPIIELLTNPNPTQSGTSFKKQLSSFDDICGEAFVIVTLSTKGEPLELYIIRPQDVTATSSTLWGINPIAESYLITNTRIVETFRLDPLDFRYKNALGNRKLLHIKEFNPSWGMGLLRGLPKAAPLFLQIQQFIAADTNNLSQLQRGGRPSLAWIWKHEDPMTDAQFERWNEQVKQYEGAMNAGKQVLLDDMDVKVVSANMRDMEFSNNRKTVKEDIYTCYSIPLAIVSSESMTMDNLKVSNTLLYEQSVLPHTDNLLDELTRFLMPLYKTPKVVLTYNPIELQALKDRMIDEAKNIQIMGIASDNELRSKVGMDDVKGGDVIYKPSTLVPIGGSTTLGENAANMAGDPAQEGAEVQAAKRLAFVKQMQSVLTVGGERAFTDAYITLSANKLYG